MSRQQQFEIKQIPTPDEIKEVQIDRLLKSPYQTRFEAYEEEEDLKQLAVAIERVGLKQLPMVRPSPNKEGFYELMTGHRRREAVRKFLKWKTIRCEVYNDLPEETILYIVGEDNLARRNIYPYEKGRYFNIWHERMPDDDALGELFGVSGKSVWSWRRFADAIDELGDPLGSDGKKKLVKNATRQKLDLLLQIEDENDLVTACWKVANDETIEKLQEFVIASLNASAKLKHSPSIRDAAAMEGEEDYPRKLLTSFKRFEKAKSYEEAVEVGKEIKSYALKTLDDYMQKKAQLDGILNAKTKGVINIRKPGSVKVIHKADGDGSVLCIHQQKGAKLPPIKFRIEN
jgi:ParB/RepB/Spo0J family partition protein